MITSAETTELASIMADPVSVTHTAPDAASEIFPRYRLEKAESRFALELRIAGLSREGWRPLGCIATVRNPEDLAAKIYWIALGRDELMEPTF